MHNKKLLALALSLPLILAGCSSTYKGKNVADGASGADGAGVSAYDNVNGQDVAFGDELKENTFYFEYDSSKVKEEGMQALKAHAKYLASHPDAHARLEGHTDERGSREYNVALGERRAQAIDEVLVMNGANKDQLSLVSYGREKPARSGHSESEWQFNRRAIVAYEES